MRDPGKTEKWKMQKVAWPVWGLEGAHRQVWDTVSGMGIKTWLGPLPSPGRQGGQEGLGCPQTGFQTNNKTCSSPRQWGAVRLTSMSCSPSEAALGDARGLLSLAKVGTSGPLSQGAQSSSYQLQTGQGAKVRNGPLFPWTM